MLHFVNTGILGEGREEGEGVGEGGCRGRENRVGVGGREGREGEEREDWLKMEEGVKRKQGETGGLEDVT